MLWNFFRAYEQESFDIVEWQENTLDMCFPACPCTYNDHDSVGRDISDDTLRRKIRQLLF